jgi:hypothetical protein
VGDGYVMGANTRYKLCHTTVWEGQEWPVKSGNVTVHVVQCSIINRRTGVLGLEVFWLELQDDPSTSSIDATASLEP